MTNGQLEMKKFLPLLLLWSALLKVLTCVHVFIFITDLEDFVAEVADREVQKLTIRALAVLMGLVSTTMKVLPILYRHSLMQFWVENCKILQFIARRETDGFSMQKTLVGLGKRSKYFAFSLLTTLSVLHFTSKFSTSASTTRFCFGRALVVLS